MEALIPKRKRDKSKTYARRKGAGRKGMEPEKIFEAIVFVLRTGIQWKALPKEFGSSSSTRLFSEMGERWFLQENMEEGACRI